MSKRSRKTPADHGVVNETRSDKPTTERNSPAPGEPPREFDETPDEAVAGRDRLIENENRRMEPGVVDSADS